MRDFLGGLFAIVLFPFMFIAFGAIFYFSLIKHFGKDLRKLINKKSGR